MKKGIYFINHLFYYLFIIFILNYYDLNSRNPIFNHCDEFINDRFGFIEDIKNIDKKKLLVGGGLFVGISALVGIAFYWINNKKIKEENRIKEEEKIRKDDEFLNNIEEYSIGLGFLTKNIKNTERKKDIENITRKIFINLIKCIKMEKDLKDSKDFKKFPHSSFGTTAYIEKFFIVCDKPEFDSQQIKYNPMLAIHIASNCSHLLFISFEFLKVDNPKDMSFPKDEDKLNYNRFIEFHQLLVNLSTDNYFLFDAVLKENDFKNSIGNDIIMFFLQLIKFNIRFRKRENVEIKLKTELKKIEKEDFLNVEFKNYIELFEYLGEKQIKPL